MKDLLSKKVVRRTLSKGFLIIAFMLVAFLVLFLVETLGGLQFEDTTYYGLGILAAIFVVQWIISLCIIGGHTSEDGESTTLNAAQWIFSFLPAVILVAAYVVAYIFLNDIIPFFTITTLNYAFGLVLAVFVVVILYAISLFIGSLIPSESERQKAVVMRLVNPDDPEAANALGSVTAKVMKPHPADDRVFPDLVEMDEEYAAKPYVAAESADIGLKDLCEGFGNYLESKNMYYSKETLRSFVSGLACSHFLILEGMSGTGKTSLPRYFAEYTGANVGFTSVQSSWRERSDVLGYFNDFVGRFKETPFLRSLYRANWETDNINLLVLDEMNLSRVEYYFADFISILELDKSLWKIELMPVSTGGVLPEKLDECSITIPENVWFIGTANQDESTHNITDKVYDRAIVINFAERNENGVFNGAAEPLHLGVEKINQLFEAAKSNEAVFGEAEYAKFSQLTKFMQDAFDVNFGNRVLNQITNFVPVYVACGGTVEKALDLMFSQKVLRKLGNRFDDDVKENLTKLEKLILSLYDRESFSDTLDVIAKLKRKLF